MPAIDECEPQVIRALHKAGWLVTDNPLHIHVAKRETIFIDLRLEHIPDATSIIVIEVKCFSSTRTILDEFYQAIGQYLFYRSVLKLLHFNVPLYLSVPKQVYDDFFNRVTVQDVINDAKIKLIVIDIEKEEVVSWLH